MSFLHVPDVPAPVADLLFGCGCHELPSRLAGESRFDELLQLASGLRPEISPTTTWLEVVERVRHRALLHADLLGMRPPTVCGRGTWRARMLGGLADVLATPRVPISPATLAIWRAVQDDVLVWADDVEQQIVRAWFAMVGANSEALIMEGER